MLLSANCTYKNKEWRNRIRKTQTNWPESTVVLLEQKKRRKKTVML